jgi:phosphoribosylamine--glycine ligase
VKVLVIGGGGREHALAWKLAQSPHLDALYCAPGNPGTRSLARNVAIEPDDIAALRRFARDERIDLTVVGPEAPLALGITDAFEAEGLRVFGPTQAAAQLESSKIFAKRFLLEAGIPTASAVTFDDQAAAESHIRGHTGPLVVKADGLAAGKGVSVCHHQHEALQAVRQAMQEGVFGDAGRRVVLEEFLDGEEASFHVLVDGRNVVPLATSQDHKRAYDGDLGPNTGGMGAYAPAPVVSDGLQQRIMDEIVMPTVNGMAARGTPYRGVLYAGLMIVENRPYVIEFNVRFGDPETQVLLMLLHDDLLPLLDGAARGQLGDQGAQSLPGAAVCVVMAAQGYPGSYPRGMPITGIETAVYQPNARVFHAGTEERDGRLVTSGGRVLGVTAHSAGIAEAIAGAYRAVECIEWPGRQYRRDIGRRALQHVASAK